MVVNQHAIVLHYVLIADVLVCYLVTVTFVLKSELTKIMVFQNDEEANLVSVFILLAEN